MDTAYRFYLRLWRPALLVVSLALIAYLLFFHRLGNLLPGYSALEQQTFASASNWHTILHNPIDAPYKLAVWVQTGLAHQGLLAPRVAAASLGVLAAACFFAVVRSLYQFRTAFLASILFASSAGFLHYARLGSSQILQMGILVFVVAVFWYRRQQRFQLTLGYGLVLLCAVLCYVPGLIWFELFALALLQRGLRRRIAHLAPFQIAAGLVLFLVVLAPLLWAIIKQPHLALVATGLPPTMSALEHLPLNTLKAILSVGVRSNGNPTFWVGHVPLLNVIELALGLVGAYFYIYRERSARTIFLVGSVVISVVLIGAGGSVGFASLIPLLYLFIASGLDHLLGQWLSVFPRNPIARYTGVGLVCIMLFFSALYQVRSYFVVWPNARVTQQTFNRLQP